MYSVYIVNGGIYVKETTGFYHSFNSIHFQRYDIFSKTYRKDCRSWRQSDYDVIVYEVHTRDALHIAMALTYPSGQNHNPFW